VGQFFSSPPSASVGQLSFGGVTVGNALGQVSSAIAGAFPGGAQAVVSNLVNAVEDPAGTLAALLGKIATVSLHINFDVNNLDVLIPAGSEPPNELTAAEIAETSPSCVLYFKADATLSIEASLSAVGQSLLNYNKSIPLLTYCTQCDNNPFVQANQAAGYTPFAYLPRSSPGTLIVTGTAGNDVIYLAPSANGGVQVTENGVNEDFGSGINGIWVYLDGEDGSVNGGNDDVSIDPSLSSSYSVYVIGGSGTNVFTAQVSSGNEFAGPIDFLGGSGNNTLIGGSGDSTLTADGASGSQELLEGGSGTVYEDDEGSGTDTMVGGSGDSYIYAGPGNDTLIAGDGYNYMDGGDVEDGGTVDGGGNDVLRGPSDAAGVSAHGVMIGGQGNVIINVGTVSTGSWILIGGALNYQDAPLNPPDNGSKLIIGGKGNSTIIAGDAYEDSNDNYHPISGSGNPSAIFGGPGNDSIYGGAGGDFIASGWFGSDEPAGNDTIYAGTSTQTWTQMADLPDARQSLASATGKDGTVYAIGGLVSSSGAATAEVDAYHPTTNTWSQVASLPTARYTLAATAGSDGTIYAMGGETGNGLSSELDAYSVVTNSWTVDANLPTPRSILAAATGPNGEIYAIGGINGQYAVTSEVDAYAPWSNTWTQVASLPTARNGLAAVTGPDGLIYAIGGLESNYATASAEVDAYNPATNTWTQVASLPTARYNLTAAVGADGRIYAIGGYTSSGVTNEVDAYDPATNTWTQVAGLPVAADNGAATVGPNGKIYDIGGYTPSGGITSTMNVLDTNSDTVIYGDVSQATAGGSLVPSDTLPPGAETQGATAITYTGATLNATVYPEGNATTVSFVYGTSSGPTTTVTEAIGSGSEPVTVSIPVTGLVPDSAYSFRVEATNSNGMTAGETSSFATPAHPTSSSTPPLVTVTSVLPETVSIKTGTRKRAKSHKVTELHVQFSGDIASGAVDLGAYQLLAGTTKKGHTKYNTVVFLASATYYPSSDLLTLVTAGKLNPSRPAELTITASQLTDDYGRPLNGGRNVVVSFR
jgi:N-acetylneuraminic acid mutarotase